MEVSDTICTMILFLSFLYISENHICADMRAERWVYTDFKKQMEIGQRTEGRKGCFLVKIDDSTGSRAVFLSLLSHMLARNPKWMYNKEKSGKGESP